MLLDIIYVHYTMRGSRKFCQRGSKFDFFFFKLMRGYIGPPVKMAFRWCADDGPTLNAALVAL